MSKGTVYSQMGGYVEITPYVGRVSRQPYVRVGLESEGHYESVVFEMHEVEQLISALVNARTAAIALAQAKED